MGPATTTNPQSPPFPTGVPLPAHLADATADETSLRRFLLGLPGVDPVGRRAARGRAGDPVDQEGSKLAAIDLAISMVDLTTLEGADTPGKVRNLARKAMLPDPGPPRHAATAAVCVYPDMVGTAVAELAGQESRSPRWPRPSPPAGRVWRSSWPTPRWPSTPARTRSTW